MIESFLIASAPAEAVALLITTMVALAVFMVGNAVMFAKFYRKAGPEEAIIRSGHGGLKAATGFGIWVVPIVHRAEKIDLSVKRIDVARIGKSAVVCRDNIHADIKATFLVRVDDTQEDILNVAQSLGCRRASDQTALAELLEPGFSEALEKAAGDSTFSELREDRERFKERVFELVGEELNGLVVDNCSISHFEQTRVEKSDPVNILVGQSCVVTTPCSENNHGQARHVQMEAAPLLLNVRSTDTSLTKGDPAVIVGFDEHQHTYTVEKVIKEATK